MSLLGELKRRNVFRVSVAYALAAWVLLQIIDFVLGAISSPDWILQVFILAAVAGLLIVAVFSWVYEVTPEGLRREKDIDRTRSITPQTGRKLDRIIIIFLSIVVVVMAVERFVIDESPDAPEMGSDLAVPSDLTEPAAEAVASASSKSIAVLPFLALSSGPDDGYFADGLTEEILNSLAQLPELLVTSRTSAFHFKGKDAPVSEIAATLGVANIVEGSVRRVGDRLRVTVQLIRASDGFHLWSENYDSTSRDTIAVQEDIAEKIAAAMDVVMDAGKREAMQRVGLRDVEAFIALQKGLELFQAAHGEPELFNILRRANQQFEIVMRRVPGYSGAYQAHSDFYVHILLSSAARMHLTGVTDQELAGALDNLTADLAAAIEHAASPQERNNLELDQAFLLGNWRGLPARIERFAGQQGCAVSTWVDFVAFPFGYADRMLERMNEVRRCDPLYSSAWVAEARALLWAGDHAAALEIALHGIDVAPGGFLAGVLVRTRIANGQFDLATQDINTRLRDDGDGVDNLHRIMVAATLGNKAELDAQLQPFRDGTAATSGFNKLLYSAWGGDRLAANAMAATIDASPIGSTTLITVINWCTCGAPWDLSATPNFARLLKESELAWPPSSPLTFPLKDW